MKKHGILKIFVFTILFSFVFNIFINHETVSATEIVIMGWDGGYSLVGNRIARLSNGRLYSVYSVYADGNYYVAYKSSTDDGTTWSSETKVSQTDNDLKYRPEIVVDKHDVIHIMWVEMDELPVIDVMYYWNSSSQTRTVIGNNPLFNGHHSLCYNNNTDDLTAVVQIYNTTNTQYELWHINNDNEGGDWTEDAIVSYPTDFTQTKVLADAGGGLWIGFLVNSKYVFGSYGVTNGTFIEKFNYSGCTHGHFTIMPNGVKIIGISDNANNIDLFYQGDTEAHAHRITEMSGSGTYNEFNIISSTENYIHCFMKQQLANGHAIKYRCWNSATNITHPETTLQTGSDNRAWPGSFYDPNVAWMQQNYSGFNYYLRNRDTNDAYWRLRYYKNGTVAYDVQAGSEAGSQPPGNNVPGDNVVSCDVITDYEYIGQHFEYNKGEWITINQFKVAGFFTPVNPKSSVYAVDILVNDYIHGNKIREGEDLQDYKCYINGVFFSYADCYSRVHIVDQVGMLRFINADGLAVDNEDGMCVELLHENYNNWAPGIFTYWSFAVRGNVEGYNMDITRRHEYQNAIDGEFNGPYTDAEIIGRIWYKQKDPVDDPPANDYINVNNYWGNADNGNELYYTNQTGSYCIVGYGSTNIATTSEVRIWCVETGVAVYAPGFWRVLTKHEGTLTFYPPYAGNFTIRLWRTINVTGILETIAVRDGDVSDGVYLIRSYDQPSHGNEPYFIEVTYDHNDNLDALLVVSEEGPINDIDDATWFTGINDGATNKIIEYHPKNYKNNHHWYLFVNQSGAWLPFNEPHIHKIISAASYKNEIYICARDPAVFAEFECNVKKGTYYGVPIKIQGTQLYMGAEVHVHKNGKFFRDVSYESEFTLDWHPLKSDNGPNHFQLMVKNGTSWEQLANCTFTLGRAEEAGTDDAEPYTLMMGVVICIAIGVIVGLIAGPMGFLITSGAMAFILSNPAMGTFQLLPGGVGMGVLVIFALGAFVAWFFS